MTGIIRVVTDRPGMYVNISNVSANPPTKESVFGAAFHVPLGEALTKDFEVDGRGDLYQVDIKDLHPNHGGQSRSLQKYVGDGEIVVFNIPAPGGGCR